jgi:hypothetical protein
MSGEDLNRRKAEELGAVDAEKLVATVPYLAKLLSKQEIAQLQKVLDAAVVNPAYEKEYEKAKEDAVIGRGERRTDTKYVVYDRSKMRKAERIRARKVRTSKNDKYIRVDHGKMLTADALSPRTNNPDEAIYLAKVRRKLESEGVWLQLRQPFGRGGRDPRVWEFWFTLGRDGDKLATKDAKIDREELLEVMGDYYDAVVKGPTLTKLQRELSRLSAAYNRGWELHWFHVKTRGEAGPLVVGVTGLWGGAELPDTDIWNLPFKLKMKAWDGIIARDVLKAHLFLLAGAYAVESNGALLDAYLRKKTRGGARALTALKVLKGAGAVADALLAITGIAGLAKWAGKKALTAGAKRKALKSLEESYLEYEMKHGALRNVTEAEIAEISLVKTVQQSGTTLGNIKGGHSPGYGTGFHKGY